MFPKYRNDNIRVSEQEARFAFVEALCSGPLFYSVEAPTSKKYQFSGKNPLSAQTDIAILDTFGARICNVEFKSKGISPSSKRFFPIYKDLQKLLREPVWGLWFQLFKAVDNTTINNFFKVMTKQIERVKNDFSDIESPGLTFHVCVLQQSFSLHKKISEISCLSKTGYLSIDLNVSRSELTGIHNQNGWKLHKP